MKGVCSFFCLVFVLLVGLTLPAQAQVDFPLDRCRNGAFSVEEDFMMTEGEPYDGIPYVSDGDLLSVDGQVCARNRDLLRAFEVRPDLGLDAVDIIDFDKRVVAFSTELDDPAGKFTAGDLLTTTGIVIPNLALVAPFDIGYDIGLDGVKFIGDPERILSFLDFAQRRDPESWRDGTLQEALKRYGVDIWFTTEGTFGAQQPHILDGDLLSASGGIVFKQEDLLPVLVTAGIPERGVDFGLDAFATSRDPEAARENLLFSTEILFRNDRFSFNDGDVLALGDGIAVPNEALIKAFVPRADFLGLDALWMPLDIPPLEDPNIQTMCGRSRTVADFDGGMVPINAGGTGLYSTNYATLPPGEPPLRPCGLFVPIDGYLPPSGVTRFRVVFRDAGVAAPSPGTSTSGIRTNWKIYERHTILIPPFPPISVCLPTGTLNTDALGWMDASDFLEAKNGGPSTGFCANPHLHLAVWDTKNSLGLGFGAPNPDGHYVLWLEWEDSSGFHREAVDHHLQLDNTLPYIAPYTLDPTIADGLEVRLSDGTTTVAACGEAPQGDSDLQVWSQFADDYYWRFSLNVRGGIPPASVSYGPHNYYDLNDGTLGIKNTDDTGTIPDGSVTHIRDIDMTDLGASFVDCCYILELYVRDAAIRYTFNGLAPNDNSGAYYSYSFITFAAAP